MTNGVLLLQLLRRLQLLTGDKIIRQPSNSQQVSQNINTFYMTLKSRRVMLDRKYHGRHQDIVTNRDNIVYALLQQI